MLVNLSMDIIFSSKLTVFSSLALGELCILEQIMSADKYMCIFSNQTRASVHKVICHA